MKRLGAVMVASVMATGCLSDKSFQARMASTDSMVNTCIRTMAEAQKQQQVPVPQFTDPRDYAIYIMATALSAPKGSPYADCNTVALAAINGDARIRTALINGGVNVLGIGLGVYGATAIVDSVADIAGSSGSTYNNSRILDASDGGLIRDSSASGETLNLGNTSAIDGSLGQGGVQPRQAIVNESESTTSPSQSGTNEPPSIDPGDDSPVIQPVE